MAHDKDRLFEKIYFLAERLSIFLKWLREPRGRVKARRIFNTFIQTCKQMGVPFMSYFKKVMNELKNGRTDYQNLLPATIHL